MSSSGGPGNGAGEIAAAAVGATDDDFDPTGATLVLAPDISAAREARAWVTGMLDGWPEDALERARLLVSELVTNAVLHARTQITLRCRRAPEGARFEIGDGRRSGPMLKRYDADSPTGRGIRLVASLVESWGVDRTTTGKVVWFTLARNVPAPSPATEPGELREPDREILAAALDEPAVSQGAGPGGPPGAEAAAGRETGSARPTMVRVRILELPLEIYLEAEQHNDAVLRELDLIERSARRGPQVPPRLLELASVIRTLFSAATTSSRAQVEEALRMHRERVDLDIDVPTDGWQVLIEMADQLDEVDQFCRDGALLTLAASPRQRRFRRWYATQVASQMQGQPPSPWRDDETS